MMSKSSDMILLYVDPILCRYSIMSIRLNSIAMRISSSEAVLFNFFTISSLSSIIALAIVHKYPYLTNISNSEAVFNKNLKEIQDLAFPEDDCLPREVKKKFLNQLYKNIAQPYLKVLDNDFEIKGIIPSIQFEKEEDCPLTGFSFPYPTVKLECNHKISIMAYKGFINNQIDEFTESIRCPYCRKDLKLKFIYEPPTSLAELKNKNINFSLTPNPNFRQIIKTDFISKDSYDNL